MNKACINNRLSEEELEILQEIINIAFGKAAADLAGLIDIYVTLNVPYVRLCRTRELPGFLKTEIKGYESTSALEQRYWGRFNGVALLVFPSEAGKVLVAMLNSEKDSMVDGDDIGTLESETLKEVGNILIGACVGKVAELLNDVVTYSPPRVVVGNSPKETIDGSLFGQDSFSIMMKTVFSFKERDVNGLMFLLSSDDSLGWLKMSLNEFMEQYE
jgi:chemotaxis protein CheC